MVGWVIALTASLAFSVATPVARAAILYGMELSELLVYRFALAVILFWLTLIARNPKEVAMIPLSAVGSIALLGLISGIGQICVFYALTRLESSMVSMILATLPIFVLVILAFLGEPLTTRKIIRLGLAMLGLYLLIGPSGQTDFIGLGWVTVGILLIAVQLVLSQPLVRQYDPQVIACYIMTGMLAVMYIYWWFDDGQWHWPSSQGWIYIILLGVIGTYVARSFLYVAINRLGSGQMSLLMPLETLMSISWAGILLGERLSLIQWIGGLLVVFSAILAIQRIRLGRWPLRWRIGSRV